MARPTLLASVVVVAILPAWSGLAGPARADGFADGEPGFAVERPVRPAWRRHRAPYAWRPAVRGYAVPVAGEVFHGYLPRNLNLPIYDAPDDGPAEQL